ncbi:MAG: calcium-binding protein [Pseudomonadota bacterium]
MTGNSRLSDDIFIGNDGNNQLYGYAGWDWLDGGAGVDRIFGGEGNDFIKGGDGNDYVQSWTNGPAPGGLYGENGDDTLHGGAGKDSLFGGNGNDLFLADDDNIWDYMNGQGGNDTISYRLFERGVTIDMNVGKEGGYTFKAYGDGAVSIENVTGTDYADTITGDSQANILDGGSSNDVLTGGSGNDTLIGGKGADILRGNSGTDTVSYRHSSSGVTISLLDGTALGGDAFGDTFSLIESIEGSQYADDLQARTLSGTVSGLGGSDTFRASTGAISFDGGEGADTVDYSESTGGATVNLGSGVGSRSWAAGDSYTSIEQVIGSDHADYIYGTDGDERFQSGGGTDRMYGYDGNDSYGFTAGSGTNYVYDNGGFYDYVLVDGTIGLQDLTLSESGSTLVFGRKSTSDRMYVQNHFNTNANGLYTNQIDRLAFENGSWLWVSHLRHFVNDSNGSNTIWGSGLGDWLHGFGGNDTINGGDGLDVLIGGAGSDTLRGGAHSDTYVFGRGSGLDVIDDTGGTETLVIAGDVRTSDLMIEYSGNDLFIGLKVDGADYTAMNAPDRIKIIGQKTLPKAIEKLHIGGQVLSLPQLVGQATGQSNPPQVENRSITIYARFTGGRITSVAGYDPDGDPLTYSVTSHTSYINEDYYMLNGTNQLYTTAYWNHQDYNAASVTVTASDGTSTGSGTISITYAPDPMGGPIWPIVLDLDGNGVELLNAGASGVAWDIDEDGREDKIGWISSGDALLALDRDGSGAIDDVSEISFIQDAEGATTDLEGLRGFDFDFNGVSDGVLDANDIFFADFLLWQDTNGNGISDEGELKTLSEHGITAINLAGTPTGEEHTETTQNAILNTGTFVRTDGTTGNFGDVVLGVEHGHLSADSSGANRNNAQVLFKREGTKGGTTEEGGAIAPIIIDMNLNGIDLTPIARSVVDFDADGDGQLERIGWVERGDAILALDANGDGLITSGSEISFAQFAQSGGTDLDGLRSFDSNADGLLDSSDAIWSDLSLWTDANGDGVTQEGELVSIATTGLASINLDGQKGVLEYGGNAIGEVAKANFATGNGFAGLAQVSLGYLELESSTSNVSEETTTADTENTREAILPSRQHRWLPSVQHDSTALGFAPDEAYFATFDGSVANNFAASEPVGDIRSTAALQDRPVERLENIGSLSIQDILEDDFFDRYETAGGSDRGDLWINSRMVPAAQTAAPTSGSENARKLALLRQDLAVFGAADAIEDSLRDRQGHYQLNELYA